MKVWSPDTHSLKRTEPVPVPFLDGQRSGVQVCPTKNERYSDDSETLDKMVEDIVGDSLGIKLSMWGESIDDLFEYMSRVLKEVSKEEEMIRSVTLIS
ncbi:MAG: hypothetical protein GF411_19475 [Candidatus Lokiarchaeota archaeon]|nr:hypothetical protein [Candidatus Lokiarchaeota archaeon]